jgi:serine/threonine protein kinase
LRDELPDLATPRGDLPPALDRIVRHCLERDPDERFQSARDIVFALGTLSESGPAPTRPASLAMPSQRSAVWKVAAAGVVSGALGGVLLSTTASWWGTAPGTSTTEARQTPVLRTTINLPADTPLALGSRLMTVEFDTPAVALSPDGTYLSYISQSGQGTAVSLVELRTGANVSGDRRRHTQFLLARQPATRISDR